MISFMKKFNVSPYVIPGMRRPLFHIILQYFDVKACEVLWGGRRKDVVLARHFFIYGMANWEHKSFQEIENMFPFIGFDRSNNQVTTKKLQGIFDLGRDKEYLKYYNEIFNIYRNRGVLQRERTVAMSA